MRKSDYCDSITTSSDDIVRKYRQSIENDDSAHSLSVVHYRGGQTEFDLGRKYAHSSDPLDRITGARILSQLGWGDDLFHAESVNLLLLLAADPDERVIASALYAIGHRKSARGVPAVLRFVRHPNADLRLAAVSGLTRQDDPAAVQGLVELAKDVIPKVRSWAAFGLGTISDVDTSEVRDVLARLLDDPDPEIRGEALIGVAKRRDPRALPALVRELNGDFYGSWCLEAAEIIGDQQLLPLITRVRDSLSAVDAAAFSNDFDRAITACTK